MSDNVNWGINRRPPDAVWLEHGFADEYINLLYDSLGTMFTGVHVRCGLARLNNNMSIAPTDVIVAGRDGGKVKPPYRFASQHNIRGQKQILRMAEPINRKPFTDYRIITFSPYGNVYLTPDPHYSGEPISSDEVLKTRSMLEKLLINRVATLI